MAKYSVKSINFRNTRGWPFVILLGTVLALLAVIDQGGFSNTFGAAATDPAGCRLEVTADQVNIRTGPSQDAPLVETLARGAVVDGTREVADGFRQLGEGRWAADQFLTPLPNTNCA